MLTAEEKPPISVVGEVKGQISIIIDDTIDEEPVASLVTAAEELEEKGSEKIFVLTTHGLSSSDALDFSRDSFIDELVVTNAVPREIQRIVRHKMKTIDIFTSLDDAFRRIHYNKSISHLFRNFGRED